MHTGVKSFGCENSTAHESPIQSWNRIVPSVVSASKSGAVSPIFSVIPAASVACVACPGPTSAVAPVFHRATCRYLGARPVEQLEKLVRGEADFLVVPLGGAVDAGDQP